MEISDFLIAEEYHAAESPLDWLIGKGDNIAIAVETLLAHAEIPKKRRQRIAELLDFDKPFPPERHPMAKIQMDRATRIGKADRLLRTDWLKDEAFEVTYTDMHFNDRKLKKIVVTDDIYRLFDLIPLSMHVTSIEARGRVLAED